MALLKKALFVTNNMDEYVKTKNKLSEQNIKIYTKVSANDGSESTIFSYLFKTSRRSRGSFLENPQYQKTYYIYVKKDDFDLAKKIIGKY